MEKAKYKITIEGPDDEATQMLSDYLLRDKEGLTKTIADYHEKKRQGKENEQQQAASEKEKFLSGIRQFEKVIQIIQRCIEDESSIDTIAEILGIPVQPKATEKP